MSVSSALGQTPTYPARPVDIPRASASRDVPAYSPAMAIVLTALNHGGMARLS